MREMKDSGVEWIGKIPKDWEIARIKNVTHRIIVGLATSVTQYYRENGTPILRNTNIYQYKLDDSDVLYLDPYWASKQFSKLIHTNDILTVHTGYIGESCLVPPKYNNCLTFTTLVSTANKEKILPKYLMCEINSSIGKSKIYFTTDTGAQNNLNVSDFANLEIVVPAIKEQERILNYLDSRSFDINKMIADIQSEIDTLEKYKRSVITEAVTKGLNKDVEMKDSGVEWIGKIPQNWSISKIGNFFHLRNEKNTLPRSRVKLLSLYSKKGVFPTGEEGTTNSGNHAQTVEGYKVVHKDDIVVNIILAWMGSLGVSDYNGVCSPAYDVYVPDKNKIVPHYYHYVFRTSGIAGECYRYGRGIMMMRWRTYSHEFKQIKVPYPPMVEQQSIAEYLDSKCADIDKTISQKQQQLDILNRYKKSLIYEYVTGKKEVPSSWQN